MDHSFTYKFYEKWRPLVIANNLAIHTFWKVAPYYIIGTFIKMVVLASAALASES